MSRSTPTKQHTEYFPDSFETGRVFTAFSHYEVLRIVGTVTVVYGSKDQGYTVEFKSQEHDGWKLVDELRGLDYFWCDGLYECSHAGLTRLYRVDGEHWRTFEEKEKVKFWQEDDDSDVEYYGCEKCGRHFDHFDEAQTHEDACGDDSDDDR